MATTGLIKQLLEAGVHFGHQTRRWNPKMAPYIFGERNGIYIIDLEKTAQMLLSACDFLKGLAAKGKPILFVGTKKQAREVVAQEATKCSSFYINERWAGGSLTNFQTIRKSAKRLSELEEMEKQGIFSQLKKKEASRLGIEMQKLHRNLSGIIKMTQLPTAVYIIDAKKEELALKEAVRLSIPVVALVDTNTDPAGISYPIPGNDDAIKSISFITSTLADAVLEGRKLFKEGELDEAARAEKEMQGELVKAEEVEQAEEVAVKKIKAKREDMAGPGKQTIRRKVNRPQAPRQRERTSE
jgi:small subunit ribosomal protein S2